MAEPTTYIYKRAGGCDICADLYMPPGAASSVPVLLWVHGGALIMGGRESPDERVKEHALALGAALVSIDYRLCPETVMSELVADVCDAVSWVRREGPRLFGADPDRIIAAGSSAGGYLALTIGFKAEPVAAVLDIYGYGDLVRDWYSAPSPHARHALPEGVAAEYTESEAWAEVSGPPIANSADRQGDGGLFYNWCRRHGSWPANVSGGWDPIAHPELFHPFMAEENVTPDYPPTL